MLHPIRPGEPFAKGWRLVHVRGRGVLEYGFAHENKAAFTLGLQPKGRAERPFLAGRLVDYYFNPSGPESTDPSPEHLAQVAGSYPGKPSTGDAALPFFRPHNGKH